MTAAPVVAIPIAVPITPAVAVTPAIPVPVSVSAVPTAPRVVGVQLHATLALLALVAVHFKALRMVVHHGLQINLLTVAPLELIERVALLDSQHVDDVRMGLDKHLGRIPLDAHSFQLTQDLVAH